MLGDTLVYGPGVLRMGTNNALPFGPGKGNVGLYQSNNMPGTLDVAGYTVTVNGLSAGGNPGTGVIDNTTGSGTLAVGTNDATSSYIGAIQNSGGALALVKTGSGTLLLAGGATNTYAGGTTVQNGVLQMGKPSALGTGGLTANGGTLDLNGNDISAGNANVLPSLAGAAGVITDNSTKAGDLLTVNQAINTSFGGTIQNGPQGTVLSLEKDGAGQLTLSGQNTYGGGTTINNGTLAYGANNVLPTSGTVNVNGGVLSMSSYNGTVGPVTLTGGTISGTTGVLTGTSYSVQSGVISADLGDNSGSVLQKTTGGTVVLSGNNSYAGGTVVQNGLLQLGNTGVLGTGALAANGGTLDLAGYSVSVPSFSGAAVRAAWSPIAAAALPP